MKERSPQAGDFSIKYTLDNEPTSGEDATAKIKRYMVWSGQTLCYKIGELKIRELREKYTNQLGDRFKLSEFHDQFLKDGSMPLKILEKKIDGWAEKQFNKVSK